jgi:hypothetical protein
LSGEATRLKGRAAAIHQAGRDRPQATPRRNVQALQRESGLSPPCRRASRQRRRTVSLRRRPSTTLPDFQDVRDINHFSCVPASPALPARLYAFQLNAIASWFTGAALLGELVPMPGHRDQQESRLWRNALREAETSLRKPTILFTDCHNLPARQTTPPLSAERIKWFRRILIKPWTLEMGT